MPLSRFEARLPIFDWKLVAGGKHIAYMTDALHGNPAPHYYLFDVATGRLIKEWDEYSREKAPEWTKDMHVGAVR